MHLLIDFHYADDWADPQKQPTPEAWRSLSLSELASAVKKHTQETLDKLAAQGTPADSVQVGNEIRNGILWPLGRRSARNLAPLATLLRAGVEGVRAAKGGRKTRVMIHHDQGGNSGSACSSSPIKAPGRAVRLDRDFLLSLVAWNAAPTRGEYERPCCQVPQAGHDRRNRISVYARVEGSNGQLRGDRMAARARISREPRRPGKFLTRTQ